MEELIKDCYENGNIKSETYYINDKLHREDGPASIEYNPKGGYFLRTLFYQR